MVAGADAGAQSVRFVATDGDDSSDCLDVGTPCLTIAHALSVADAGDTIEIAAGSYKPDPGPPATSLVIDKDITLQGAGPEQTWILRDLADPAYRLITIDADPGGHQVVLSGLRLRLGFADGAGEAGRGGAIYNLDAAGTLTLNNVIVDFNQARVGGGLFNGKGVSPVIEDSTFEGNLAAERGGALYNWTDSAPQLSNVQFVSNSAEIYGGALFNSGNNALVIDGSVFHQNSAVSGCGAIAMKNILAGAEILSTSFIDNSTEGDGGAFCLDAASPIFNGVIFQSNAATSSAGDNSGGAIWIINGSAPQFTDTTFAANSSDFLGGALHVASGSSPVLNHVTFDGNSAVQGGAIHSVDSSSAVLKDVTFSNNVAAANGGAMFNSDTSHPLLENVRFLANQSGMSGGGMFNTNASHPVVKVSVFEDNVADQSGGGMANEAGSNPDLLDVTFRGNESKGLGTGCYCGGGGVSNLDSDPTISNTRFLQNTAPRGGGMFNVNSSPQLVNVMFFENTADLGGGINNDSHGTPSLTNVSFSANHATHSGGALANSVFGDAVVYNTIFWANSAASGNEIHVSGTSSLTLHNTLYSNAAEDAVVDGTLLCIECMLNVDPSFVDAGNGNLMLEADSPAIDAGAPSTDPSRFPTDEDSTPIDIFGWSRFYGASVDMGVNEWQPRPDDLFRDRFQSP